jgi:AhpD family alkylhydroperoxidase
MPNISPVNPALPGAAATVLNGVKAKLGGVPNIFATMAHSPAALEGFLAFGGALSTGILSAGLSEQIALAVAGENNCDYCASAHTLMAKGAGIGAAEASLNLAGKASDPKVSAILKFARTVVQSRGRDPANASSLNELRTQGVSDGEIVEILAHVGLNLFTNYFNHVADTEIDFPFVTAAAKQSVA